MKILIILIFSGVGLLTQAGCVPDDVDSEDSDEQMTENDSDSNTAQLGEDTTDIGLVDDTDFDKFKDEIYGDINDYLNRHSAVADTFFGFITLAVEHIERTDSLSTNTDLNAQFYEVLSPGSSENIGEIIKEMRGFNDCSVFIWEGNGYSQLEQRIGLDAGDAVLLYEEVEIPLDVRVSDIIRYETHFTEHNVSPVYGGTYTFSATGYDTPSFDMDITLPTDLRVTLANHPDLNEAPTDDLDIAWTNDSEGGLVTIYYTGLLWELSADGGSASSQGPYYNITCIVDDDGGFSIPGGFLSMIPSDYSGLLTVTRALESYDELDVNKWVKLNGSVSHTIYLAYPQN